LKEVLEVALRACSRKLLRNVPWKTSIYVMTLMAMPPSARHTIGIVVRPGIPSLLFLEPIHVPISPNHDGTIARLHLLKHLREAGRKILEGDRL